MKVDDELPLEFWEVNHKILNFEQNVINFSKHKNSLIILEFWSSTCSACHNTLPKISSLKELFKDRVQILLVSSQNKVDLEKFFNSKFGAKFKNLPSIYDDEILKNYFYHRGVPYVVWIYNGKIINFTDAEQLTEKSISEILDGKNSGLKTIKHLDRNRPLLLTEEYESNESNNLLSYSIISKGKLDGIGSGSALRNSKSGKIIGRMFSNLSLKDIHFIVGSEIFKNKNQNASFNAKRFYINFKENYNQKIDEWTAKERSNLYNVDYIIPEKIAHNLYESLLQNLNNYSDFQASFEKMKVKCYVLIRTSTKDKIATKGGSKKSTFPRSPSKIQNLPIHIMVNMLNGETILKYPVIDETGYNGNVDITLTGIKEYNEVRKELSKYDLDLFETERELLMMVISNK